MSHIILSRSQWRGRTFGKRQPGRAAFVFTHPKHGSATVILEHIMGGIYRVLHPKKMRPADVKKFLDYTFEDPETGRPVNFVRYRISELGMPEMKGRTHLITHEEMNSRRVREFHIRRRLGI